MPAVTTRFAPAFLIALALLAGACSREAGTTAAPTLAPERDTVLATAAEAMGAVESVRFSIERSGAPVHIDPADLLVFNTAEGRFVAPSSADALVTIGVAGFNTEIGAIAFEGRTWLSDPITGRFSPAPGSYAFDPATLFDPEVGWRPLLAAGLSDIEWIGLVGSDDEPRYRLRGSANPERVAVITAGLVEDQEVVLDIALDARTGEVREVEFSTVNGGETSTWTLTFSGYGEPLEVSPPPTDAGD